MSQVLPRKEVVTRLVIMIRNCSGCYKRQIMYITDAEKVEIMIYLLYHDRYIEVMLYSTQTRYFQKRGVHVYEQRFAYEAV